MRGILKKEVLVPEQRRAEKMVLEHWNTWKRLQQDRALKQEELELKKQENERLQNIQTQQIQMFKVMMDQQQQVQKQEKDDMSKMLKTLLDQQQHQQRQVQDMQNLLLMQQQTQTQAMMALLEKRVPKWLFHWGYCPLIVRVNYLLSFDTVDIFSQEL